MRHCIYDELTESELYKELGIMTKDKDKWKESIPYVFSLLARGSVKIQAKALWLLGEMGLKYPLSVQDAVPAIASFLDSPVPLLRERAVNALGRIGRGDYRMIEPYRSDLFRFASDEEAQVRLSFIWASENIATTCRTFTGMICRYLKSCCTIRMTGYGWRRRRFFASSANAGRNSSGLIWSICSK